MIELDLPKEGAATMKIPQLSRKTWIAFLLLAFFAGAGVPAVLRRMTAASPEEADPLRERALRAAAIAGELSGFARSRLGGLPPGDRREVEGLLFHMEERTKAVRVLLEKERSGSVALESAVEDLEAVLDSVLRHGSGEDEQPGEEEDAP